jgi:hypothetical protein
VLIDSGSGLGVGWSGFDTADTVKPEIVIESNVFFGQSEIPDCPDGGNAGICFS